MLSFGSSGFSDGFRLSDFVFSFLEIKGLFGSFKMLSSSVGISSFGSFHWAVEWISEVFTVFIGSSIFTHVIVDFSNGAIECSILNSSSGDVSLEVIDLFNFFLEFSDVVKIKVCWINW